MLLGSCYRLCLYQHSIKLVQMGMRQHAHLVVPRLTLSVTDHTSDPEVTFLSIKVVRNPSQDMQLRLTEVTSESAPAENSNPRWEAYTQRAIDQLPHGRIREETLSETQSLDQTAVQHTV